MTSFSLNDSSSWMGNYNLTMQKYVQYNPFDAVNKYSGKYGSKKSAEPILYDPFKAKSNQK